MFPLAAPSSDCKHGLGHEFRVWNIKRTKYGNRVFKLQEMLFYCTTRHQIKRDKAIKDESFAICGAQFFLKEGLFWDIIYFGKGTCVTLQLIVFVRFVLVFGLWNVTLVCFIGILYFRWNITI